MRKQLTLVLRYLCNKLAAMQESISVDYTPPKIARKARSVDVDVNGDKWDPSIHVATKAKTAAGAWRKKGTGRKKARPEAAEL